MILLNGHKVEIKQFPNGETLLEKSSLDVRSVFSDSYIKKPDTLTLKYESDKDLFALFLIRKHLFTADATRDIELEIPYFPYSRMDRTSTSHVFTLKYVCDFINNLFFSKVRLYEPHSDVTPALLNNCVWYEISTSLLKKTDFDRRYDFVCYPDTTAHKRYSKITKTSQEILAIKNRDFKTGRIKNLELTGRWNQFPGLQGARVFIIDDLCSKGRTFTMAAGALKNIDAGEINLVVAHCENAIFNGDILKTKLISNVYTTDTIITDNRNVEKLHVFPYNKF